MTINSTTIRRALAVVASVYAVLTQYVTVLHISPAVAGPIAAFGPLLLTAEHVFGVSDTTTTNKTVTPTPAAPTTTPGGQVA